MSYEFYVHRNDEGKITSIHGELRPGYAEELLNSDTSQDLADYLFRFFNPVANT